MSSSSAFRVGDISFGTDLPRSELFDLSFDFASEGSSWAKRMASNEFATTAVGGGSNTMPAVLGGSDASSMPPPLYSRNGSYITRSRTRSGSSAYYPQHPTPVSSSSSSSSSTSSNSSSSSSSSSKHSKSTIPTSTTSSSSSSHRTGNKTQQRQQHRQQQLQHLQQQDEKQLALATISPAATETTLAELAANPQSALELLGATALPADTNEQFVDISDYLVMPQGKAATTLGLAPSTLSKRWKESTRGRNWPWRAVIKIDKEISLLMHNVTDGEIADEVQAKLGRLLALRKQELRPVYIRMAITTATPKAILAQLPPDKQPREDDHTDTDAATDS